MITSRGLVAAFFASALAISGSVYGVEEFLLVSITVGVLFVTGIAVLWWRALATKRALEVEIRVPVAEVIAGQPAAADLRVFNTGRRSSAPLVVQEPQRRWRLSYPGLAARSDTTARPPSNGASAPRPVTVPDPEDRASRGSRAWFIGFLSSEKRHLGNPTKVPGLRRGAEMVVKIPVPTASRGLLSLRPLGLWCEDPFQFFAWRVASTPLAHVLVCPSPEFSGARHRTSSGGQGAHTPESSENVEAEGMQGGYEFRALRPYVAGDRMTRLHWPAFARSGELVVRDFVEPVSGCISLLVDLRPTAHKVGTIEAVVARAAGLGLQALESSYVVELCTSAGDRVEIVPGSDSRQSLLRSLAVLGPVTAPMSAALRWSGTTTSAVWAPTNTRISDVVLVTTAKGAASALPETLATRTEKVVV